jgi:hypothetical protein
MLTKALLLLVGEINIFPHSVQYLLNVVLLAPHLAQFIPCVFFWGLKNFS